MYVLVTTNDMTWGVAKWDREDELFHSVTLALINSIQSYHAPITRIKVQLISDDYKLNGVGVSASFIADIYSGVFKSLLMIPLVDSLENTDAFFEEVLDDQGINNAYEWCRTNEKEKDYKIET